MMKYMIMVLLLAVAVRCFAQTIPLDRQLRTGRLANGFTYYIRHNEQPQKRVELYLVNKVGSILEDDDQRGLAHFMEHMNFNGTRNYPKNELVDYLQKAGVRFGADLNAYTSFDETVYQLPIPVDDPAMFGRGIGIMRDWAQEATLDPAEIEKERGVVLEEERLGKGARDRISRRTLPAMLNHARYADRIPIGTDEVLTKFKPEVIKRFYTDWYRPDLQALIIVGDIDVNEAEKLVKAKFADLKNPVNERARIRYSIPLTGKSQFLAVTDKEETGMTLQVLMKHRAPELKTEQDYLESIKQNLFNQMIDARRNTQLPTEANPGFIDVGMGISGLVNNLDAFTFAVSVKDGQLQQGFLQAWRVLEGIKRYGFTAGELDRAKQNYLRTLKSSASEQDRSPSVNYVKEYQRLFLKGEAAPGINWEYQFAQAHIGNISLPDIAALMNNYLNSANVDIYLTAPEKDKLILPDSSTVAGWISSIAKEGLKPYHEEEVSKTLLTSLPKPAKVVSRQEVPQIGVTRLTLSNGVTVVLKPTDFKNDQIYYGAFSPGGVSLYDGPDYDVAGNATGFISRMGLAGYNQAQLSQALSGKMAASTVKIDLRSTTINAGASPQDLETALQLTYLQFTAPRQDTLVFRNTLNNVISGLSNRYADPNQVFADTVRYILGGRSYRAQVPDETRLRKITLQRTLEIYRESLADAANFTFVFVGNFKVNDVIPLLERYLGSLPATNRHKRPRDLGLHAPAGCLEKKVIGGTENKTVVSVVFSGNYQFGLVNNMQLRALSDILQIKVLQRLREAEGEVYSPQVKSAFSKNPQNRFQITVQFGCAPENADHLVNLLQEEMATLRENGPAADDLEKFKAQYQKNLEVTLKENSFWFTYLLNQCENNEDLLQVQQLSNIAQGLDSASLKKAAQVFLSGENMITFELLPEQSN
jgi:zinc protease